MDKDFEDNAIGGFGFDKLELLRVAEDVARDKGIEKEEVVDAMEQVLSRRQPELGLALRMMYGRKLTAKAER